MNTEQREFLKTYRRIDQRHSSPFADFCELSAISLVNSVGTAFPELRDSKWQEREDSYLRIAKGYDREELQSLAAMLGLVTASVRRLDGDTLGELFSSDEIHGKNGKWDRDLCLTPWNVAVAMAQMTLGDSPIPEGRQWFTLCEPACGSLPPQRS